MEAICVPTCLDFTAIPADTRFERLSRSWILPMKIAYTTLRYRPFGWWYAVDSGKA